MAIKFQVSYLRKVEELVRSLDETLNGDELDEVRHFVRHGEPAEGIRALAWIIEEEKMTVDSSVKRKIFNLCCDLIDIRDMPKSYRFFLLKDEKA